jgi:hypothetical protein
MGQSTSTELLSGAGPRQGGGSGVGLWEVPRGSGQVSRWVLGPGKSWC